MANLNITEFDHRATNANNVSLTAATAPYVAVQNVAIGSSSVQSAAFDGATSLIRLSSDVVCSVEISTNPTATALKMRLGANQPEFFGVPMGAGYKIAVIAAV